MSLNIVFEDERGRFLKVLADQPSAVVPRVGETVIWGSEPKGRAAPEVFVGLVVLVEYYCRADGLEVAISCVDDGTPAKTEDVRRRWLSREGWLSSAPDAGA